MDNPRNVLRQVLSDVVTFLILGTINLIIAKIIKPTRRGFYCNDDSIRYPELSSTVPSLLLNIVGILLPIVLIIVVELKNYNRKKDGPYHALCGLKINPMIWSIYRAVACFAVGAVFSQLITDIGKKTAGRLRPNFLDACRPDLNIVCSSTAIHTYITQYKCEDGEEHNENRVSFPSGHSSFSFYVAVFCVLYLESRFKLRNWRSLKAGLQFSFVIIAWFVALSRYMDNKHHWSDISAGIVIGTVAALVNCIIVHNFFKPMPGEKLRIANRSPASDGSQELHDQV